MTEWLSDQVTKWPSDQDTEWPSDRVTKWPSKQMTGWQGDRMTGSFADNWPYGIFDHHNISVALHWSTIFWPCTCKFQIIIWVSKFNYHVERHMSQHVPAISTVFSHICAWHLILAAGVGCLHVMTWGHWATRWHQHQAVVSGVKIPRLYILTRPAPLLLTILHWVWLN